MGDVASAFSAWASRDEQPSPATTPSSVASDFARWASGPTNPDDDWETRGVVQVNRKTGEKRPAPSFTGGEPGIGKAVDPYAEHPYTAGLSQLASRTKENILNVPEFFNQAVNYVGKNSLDASLMMGGLPTLPDEGQEAADIYGHGAIRGMRESVRDEYEGAKDKLAQSMAARGVGPISSALTDTALEAGGVLAAGELTNLGSAARGALRNARGVGKLPPIPKEADPALEELASKSLAIGDEHPPLPGTEPPRSDLERLVSPPEDARSPLDAMSHGGSDVSPEAMSRSASGVRFWKVKPGGEIVPILNDVGAIDAPVGHGEVKVQTGADGSVSILSGKTTATQQRAIDKLATEAPAKSRALEGPDTFELDAASSGEDDLLASLGVRRGAGHDLAPVESRVAEAIDASPSGDAASINQHLADTRLRYTAPDGTVHEAPIGVQHAPEQGEGLAPQATGPEAEAAPGGPREQRIGEAPGLAGEPATGGYAPGDSGRTGTVPVGPDVSRETTSLRNATADAERTARGLPEVDRLARIGSGERWNQAIRRVAEEPDYPRHLAQAIAEKPRALTPLENDVLLHDRMKLILDHREALAAEETALASGDKEAATMARLKTASIEAAQDANDVAAKRAGSESGASLQARQRIITEDYSPLTLTRRAKVANLGIEPPPHVRAKLIELSGNLDAAMKRAESAESRVSELEARKVVKSVQKDVEREVRKTGRTATKQQLDAEFEGLRKMLARKTTGQANMGLDPEIAGLIAKMARNRVKAGVNGLGELVDGVWQVARHHVEGIEPRDVRDAISGYGVTRHHVAQSEAVKELAELQRQGRLVSRLEDIQGGKGLPKSGVVRRADSAEVAALKKKIREASDAAGITGEMSDEARLSALKKRLAKRQAELEGQLQSGLVVKKTRRPLALDAEALTAQADVNRLKRRADGVIKQLELKNRSGLEKGLDWTARWGRAVKLSGIATLQKIGSAAAMRTLVFKPIEEVVGAGLSRLPGVSKIAAKAPIEGGGSVDAIAKAFSEFFSKETRKEMWEHVSKMKEGKLDELYGKGKDIPDSWMEFFGHLHASVKSPPKRAAFAHAMEKQAKFYLKAGRDITDPVLQAEMAARAYEAANREIFMAPNAMVKAFQQISTPMKGDSTPMRIGRSAMKIVFPIVKVPSNFSLEVTDYALGLPKGGIRMIAAFRHGIDSLPVAEAEQILRQLKKGSIGAAAIALGASGAVEAGGYYRKKDKRKAGELAEGEVRIAGYAIPHLLLHHPLIEALQIGASMKRVRDDYHGKDGAFGEGLRTAAQGVVQQVPFFEEPARMGMAIGEEGGPTRFGGSMLRGMTIAPDIQRLARLQDDTEPGDAADKALKMLALRHIEAQKRKPKSLLQEEATGLPFFRQMVPK